MLYSLVSIIAIGVVFVLDYDVILKRNYQYKNKEAFFAYRFLLVALIVYFIADALWGILDVLDQKIFVEIDTAIYFVSMSVVLLSWFRFVPKYLEEKSVFSKIMISVGFLFFAAGLTLVVINFFYPILFSYATNQYDENTGRNAYLITQASMYAFTSLYALIVAFRHKGNKKGRFITISIVGLVMTISIIFQYFLPLYPMYGFGCLIGIVLIHSFIVQTSRSDYAKSISDALGREKAQSEELSNVKQLAYKDPLTGVKNKHAYVELEAIMDEKIRNKTIKEFALFLFDLNDLKIMNDTYGHEIGDKYIIKSCQIIKSLFPNTDVYRYGGDEFVVVLTDDYFKNRYAILDSFNKIIEKNIGSNEPIVAVGFSDYIADKDNTMRTVFARADQRMYARKNNLKEMCGKKDDGVLVNGFDNLAETNSRLANYEAYYLLRKNKFIDVLENSSADEIVEVDLINDRFHQFFHVEGKYFLPSISNSYEDLLNFTAEYIVHPSDKNIYLELMEPEGFFDRLKNSKIPNFAFAHFRYKLQNGRYRYVEQCLITGEENGIEKGKFRIYVFDIHNFMTRQTMNVGDESNIISIGRDPLTGLLTGKDFFNKAYEIIKEDNSKKWCLLAIDINHFKLFDEWFGRDKGDVLLARMGAELKAFEEKEGGLAGYFGQDNFAFLTAFNMNHIKVIYEKIRTHIDSFGMSGGLLPSIGVALVDEDTSLSNAYNRSTIAASKSKEDVTQRIVVFNNDMLFSTEKEYRILSQFMKAIQNHEIKFYLQPQCRISNGSIVGAEALSRWIREDGSIAPPIEFIPVLEKHGFITDLDKYVWEEVCIWLRKMLDKGYKCVPISLNVSRIDILNLDIPAYLSNLCKKYEIPHKLLKIEITESSYAEITSKIDELVKKLHEDDFMVLMDDFGSGYSSLNMLSNIKLDAIKLDANFLNIKGVDQNKGIHILESVVNMAKSMSLPMIVEGVENKQEVDFLSELGCRYAQGFYFYKPMPVNEFEALIKDDKKVSLNGFVVKANEQFRIREFLDKNIYSDSMLNNIIGSVAIYSWRKDHVDIIRYNQQFYESVHVPEFLDRLVNIEQFLPEEDRPLLFAALKQAKENKYLGGEAILRFYRTDGELMSFHIHFYSIGKKEGSERFYGSAVNVSDLADMRDVQKLIAQYSNDNMILVRRIYEKWQYSVISHGLSDVLNLSPKELEEELNNGKFAKRILNQKQFKKFMSETKVHNEKQEDFKTTLEIYDKNHNILKLELSFHSVHNEANNIKYILNTKVI